MFCLVHAAALHNFYIFIPTLLPHNSPFVSLLLKRHYLRVLTVSVHYRRILSLHDPFALCLQSRTSTPKNRCEIDLRYEQSLTH